MSPAGEIEITTPEGVPIRFQLASRLERFVAFVLDMVLIMTAVLALVVVTAIASTVSLLGGFWAVVLLGMFAIRYGYFVLFESLWHGATPAKRLLSLRVLARDGGGLTPGAVFARNVTREVELFLPLMVILAPASVVGPSPAWLWVPAGLWVLVMACLPLITTERTRPGDLVAGTIVVRVPRAELALDEARASSLPLGFTSDQLAIYGERELETLAQLLRDSEGGTIREDELRYVAQTVALKIHFEGSDWNTSPRRFLRAFYTAQRASLERALLFGKRKASKFDRMKGV